MQRPPPASEFQRFPVVSAIWVLCVVASLAYWSGRDMSPLMTEPQLRRGEFWRLITCTFLHGNLIHLLFNLMWWWPLGTMIEGTFGHVRTLLLFLVLAIGSSAAEYAFLHGGIGLSGVVYGAAGFVWVLSRRDPRFIGALSQQNITILAVWLFVCIFTTVTGYMRVANIAHFVGAILGALIGAAVVAPKPRRAALAFVTGVIVLGAFIGATFARPFINLSHDAIPEDRLGYQALKDNRNVDAYRWLSDAIRIDPKDAYAWHAYGVACGRLNKPDEAAAAFARAIQLEAAQDQTKEAGNETEGTGWMAKLRKK